MCTALIYHTDAWYFGRNLDLEYAFGECVTVTPRRFPFVYRHRPPQPTHYAMIGTAYIPDGYPLYYDATNEKGLSMAGLNFPDYAVYHSAKNGVAPFEVIPWVLSQCATLGEARELLKTTVITREDYRADLPYTPLHWLLADGSGAVAVEPREDGLHLIDDPVGVLTNSPPLSFHLTRLAEFTRLSAFAPPADFGGIPLPLYSRGMGGIGLPGDWSSSSRFVKAAFVKANAVCEGGEQQSVEQLFHILASVAFVRGSVILSDGRSPVTVYSSCCNTKTGVYYYKTYDNSRVRAVDLHGTDLDSDRLCCYSMCDEWEVPRP